MCYLGFKDLDRIRLRASGRVLVVGTLLCVAPQSVNSLLLCFLSFLFLHLSHRNHSLPLNILERGWKSFETESIDAVLSIHFI
jgi:hypothetical protein